MTIMETPRGQHAMARLTAALVLALAAAAWGQEAPGDGMPDEPLPATAPAPAPAPTPRVRAPRPTPRVVRPPVTVPPIDNPDDADPAATSPADTRPNGTSSTAPRDGLIPAPQAKQSLEGRKFKPLPRVEFEDADIRAIVKMVADSTGLSIFVSPNVNATAGIWASNIDPIHLLNRVAEIGDVTYYIKNDTINVVTWQEYEKQFGLDKKVIEPDFIDAAALAAAIEPFLTDSAIVSASPTGNAIIIIESPAAMQKILDLVKVIDLPDVGPVVKIVRLRHASAESLAEKIEKFFEAQEKAASSVTTRTPTVTPRPTPAPMPGVPGAQPRPRTRDRSLAGGRIITGGKGNVIIFPEERTNALIIKAYKGDMEIIEEMVSQLDVQIDELPSGVRVYRLENVPAQSVAGVITDLLAATAEKKTQAITPADRLKMFTSEAGNRFGVTTYSPPAVPVTTTGVPAGAPGPVAGSPTPGTAESPTGSSPAADQPAVAINEETNSVIIRATAEQHRELGKLIEELDRPRPQVQVEAIVVQVIDDGRLDFGVELEAVHFGSTDFQALSFFNLTSVDPLTGERRFVPSQGFNATIIEPDHIALVVKALQQSTNARISSAPKLLVNDNTLGELKSVEQQPFTSVNASDTVATTSFQGYVDAGTTLTLTPHISDSNFVRIKYEVALNSFVGSSPAAGVPPARNSNTITSEAVVPDGHTIIVGGLKTTLKSVTRNKVPLLGDIPILGYIFSTTSTQDRVVTLYVFLRPTIVRDRQFRLLKHLSATAMKPAGVKSDRPESDIQYIGL